jgi:hypothetical protein
VGALVAPLMRLEGPEVWSGAQMQSRSDWIHVLEPGEAAEVLAAVKAVQHIGTDWLDLDKTGFPLPRLAPRLAQVSEQLENGCGIAVVRGIPHEALGQEGMRVALWGIGLHLGTAVSQSKYGELLAEVRDYGEVMGKATSRGYRAAGSLRFHTDRCDVVALLCVRQCRDGGESLTVNTPHMHNVLLERDPEGLAMLYEPWFHSRQGEGQPHEKPWYRNPIFAQHKGRFTSQYSRAYVETAAQFPELPPVSARQWEVLDLVAQTAHAECFTSRMRPGDLQLLNNHVTWHARTSVTDWDETEKKRMLYRLWLSMPGGRELPADFDELWGPTASGAVRGGVLAGAGYRTTAELRALRGSGRLPDHAGRPLAGLSG